jgi:hypothetical protein
VESLLNPRILKHAADFSEQHKMVSGLDGLLLKTLF